MKVNNTPISFSLPPKLCSGQSLAPVRELAAALEAEVKWEPESRRITVAKAQILVQITLNSNLAVINGVSAELPAAISSESGSAIVPVRFLAESLGYKVAWQPGEVLILQENYP